MAAEFDLSAVIRADASQAVAEGSKFEASLDGVAGAQKRVAASGREVETGSKSLASAQTDVMRKMSDTATATTKVATSDAALTQSQDRAAGSTRKLSQALNDNEKALNRHAYGARNLGQQFGDLGLSIAGGISPARAFGQQAGQMGYALSEMGGKLGAVGKFLTGPWGIALTVGAAVLAPFIEGLFQTASASKAAEKATEDLATKVGSIGNFFDLATGKIKETNAALIQYAALTRFQDNKEAEKAIAARADVADAAFRDSTKDKASVGFYTPGGMNTVTVQQGDNNLANVFKSSRDIDGDLRRIAQSGGANADNARTILEARAFAANTRAEIAKRNKETDSLISGDLDPSLRTPGRVKHGPKAKSTASLDEFGRDSADRIKDIAESFSDAPSVVEKADKAIRTLDDLIDDLGRKKPPNFEGLIASAEAAKVSVERGLIRTIGAAFEQPKTLADKARDALKQLDTVLAGVANPTDYKGLSAFKSFAKDVESAKSNIEGGLLRPYNDFIASQEDSLRILGLQSQGRNDEADALRIVIGLEKDRAPLDQAHKDAILASVQATREEQRQVDILRDKNQKYVEAVGNIKSAVQDATQAFVRGDLGQFIKTPKKLLDAFINLQGQKLFERLFGSLFRDLEDQANGTTAVKDASDRMATAVDKASKSILNLGAAADTASGKLAANDNGKDVSTIARKLGGDDIVVTGDHRVDSVASFSKAIGGVLTKILGTFTSEDFAKKLGSTIGKYAGVAIEGAATGKFISGIANSLGIKQNSTGAQIGGAVGGVAASAFGLPPEVGQIVGSILGGTIGNLFSKPKYGTASVTSTYGTTNAAGRGADAISGANGLGGAVQTGIKQIADQLGGILGNFAVSIGTFNGMYRVSTTGFTGSLDHKAAKNQGLVDFGKDGEAAAIAYAIMDAIKDGAVQGLSASVQAALKSSPDLDKALDEALKTQQLELAIGGLGASLGKIFSDFDKTAADRVRIAQSYGLDLLAVEKLNGEERAKLLEDTLKSRVGSLQDFLNDLKFGDLFEGSASDRRAKILDEITKAQADAEKGVDGAADTLAGLYRQLTSTSRDAFGTAGAEYAADREAALTGVEKVIQMEQDRINAAAGAQKATTDALVQNNALTDETNALLAQLNTNVIALGGVLGGYGGGTFDYGSTYRNVALK